MKPQVYLQREAAGSPLKLVFPPQCRAVSEKWFPSQGYCSQSEFCPMEWEQNEHTPVSGVPHKNLQQDSFLFFNLIFGAKS